MSLENQTDIIRFVKSERGMKVAQRVLEAAVVENDTELVRELLANGVDPTGLSHHTLPLTEVAARNGNHEMVKLLQEAEAR
jgi:hypothetical protein